MWIKKSEFVDADRAGSSFKKFHPCETVHGYAAVCSPICIAARFTAVHRHVSSNTEERSVYGRDKQDYRTQQDWMGQSN